ncbi:MAG: PD-(D/E)XK nuclease domain-containing protein [Oliverpabstia sp.]|nr:PD-(D/E)XK nuclease domain-containing protein [Oliverpabstia sp.]
MENSEMVILIEGTYVNEKILNQACEQALKQIGKRKYDEELRGNGVDKILKYGIACYTKRWKVKSADAQRKI